MRKKGRKRIIQWIECNRIANKIAKHLNRLIQNSHGELTGERCLNYTTHQASVSAWLRPCTLKVCT